MFSKKCTFRQHSGEKDVCKNLCSARSHLKGGKREGMLSAKAFQLDPNNLHTISHRREKQKLKRNVGQNEIERKCPCDGDTSMVAPKGEGRQ